MTKRRKHNPEMFQSIETRSAKGESVSKLCKENNISPALFYSWRQRNRKRTRTVAVTNTAANTATNTAAATAVLSLGKDSSRGYLFVGSPKFLAEVMNQF